MGERWNELQSLVEGMDGYLDSGVSPEYKTQPLAQDWARVAKASEEVGEAIYALIGMSGQNPRKGEYATVEHLIAELADVALTGLYAIQHFTKNSDRTMAEVLYRARYHRARIRAGTAGHGIAISEHNKHVNDGD